MKEMFSMTEKPTSENHEPITGKESKFMVPPEETKVIPRKSSTEEEINPKKNGAEEPEVKINIVVNDVTEVNEMAVNVNAAESTLTKAEEPDMKVNQEDKNFTDAGQPEVKPYEMHFTEVEEVKKENIRDGESQLALVDEQPEFEHPEGGWGWVVMLASMWCNGSVFGIQSIFGILFVSLLKEFGSEDDSDLRFRTAWVGSLSAGMVDVCSPIVSVFTDVFGCRITAVSGAVVGLVGLLASSFVKSLGLMYFTYGVLFACGSSFAYQPSLVILGHYFKKRLGLVNGVVAAGCSVFTGFLSLLLPFLLDRVGLPNTLRVLCILMFVLMLAGFTYKPRLPQRVESKRALLKRTCNVQIWRSLSYRIWAFGMMTSQFGYFVPYVHLMEYVSEHFPGAQQQVILVCLGAASGVGRLIFGRVADYVPGGNKVLLQAISVMVIGVMTMLIPVCNVFGGLIAVCLVMGLCDGCFFTIMTPIAFELFSSENVSQALGFGLGMMSLPMLVGPPIAGILHDRLGSYDLAFYLAGIPALIGGAVLCAIPWLEWRKRRNERKNETDNRTAQE
ncbi:monocarboxylate transporter 10-like [Clarias gariepinus]|uniref:monocarboxylate transporter 10-like n=1 Tax=Clarias gariepinus TaxID=13013 RepID=UPI00234D8D6F|nr:monocarboxylate transporter 10-like [Clarias gariepinus]